MRIEHIALHGASTYGGAQVYLALINHVSLLISLRPDLHRMRAGERCRRRKRQPFADCCYPRSLHWQRAWHPHRESFVTFNDTPFSDRFFLKNIYNLPAGYTGYTARECDRDSASFMTDDVINSQLVRRSGRVESRVQK
jgi:hypothetical protein